MVRSAAGTGRLEGCCLDHCDSLRQPLAIEASMRFTVIHGTKSSVEFIRKSVAKRWRTASSEVRFTSVMVSGIEESFTVIARDGSRILASVGVDPAPGAVSLAREAHRFVIAAATQLRPPCGRYNCHGLVLASRRAHIPPAGVDVDLDDILCRDGYRPLRHHEAPKVGDIIAYRSNGEIEHTGYVTRIERIGSVPSIFVWSAWGSLGEFEHRVQASPYRGEPEYWRLR